MLLGTYPHIYIFPIFLAYTSLYNISISILCYKLPFRGSIKYVQYKSIYNFLIIFPRTFWHNKLFHNKVYSRHNIMTATQGTISLDNQAGSYLWHPTLIFIRVTYLHVTNCLTTHTARGGGRWFTSGNVSRCKRRIKMLLL